MTIKIIFLIIINILMTNSWSRDDQLGHFREMGYYDPHKLPMSPKNLERAILASTEINTDSGTCSGTKISDNGHYLTAAHCMDDCFNKYSMMMIDRISSFRLTNIFFEIDKKYKCGNYPDAYDLILVGNGYSEYFNTDFDYNARLIKKLDRVFGDYVILKKHSISYEKPCVPFSKKEIVPGDRIWTLGFPGRIARPNNLGSNGKSLYAGYGTVANSVFENSSFKNKYYTEWQMEVLKSKYDREEIIISDLDTYYGSSGGMVLNEEGEIVGINNFGFVASDDEEYNKNSSGALRSSYIYDQLVEILGVDKAKKVTNCSN